jgi:hypothetical protein
MRSLIITFCLSFDLSLSEFKSGRRAIHRFTGNIGIHIMDALYSCFLKCPRLPSDLSPHSLFLSLVVSNPRLAQAMQVNVYKVASKTAVFVHEKIITDEVFPHLLASHFISLLSDDEDVQRE